MEALSTIAWVSISLGIFSAIIIYVDIQMGRYQSMAIMNIAWPLTALFIWPVALGMYFCCARAPLAASGTHHDDGGMSMGHHGSDMHMASHDHSAMKKKPITFKSLYISSTHCASGCSLADMIGETLIYICGLTIAGSFLWMGFAVDYGLALIFGLAFQYYTIKPMQPDLTVGQAIKQAFKADILSLTSFQIGMYAWMFVSVFVIFHQQINAGDPVFWFMIQVAMICGMVTTMPVNYFLIKCGIKHACA